MHTVPSLPSPNNAEPSIHELADDRYDYLVRQSGHPDELSPAMQGHGAEEWAELMAGAEEYTTDQSIQTADQAHAAALRDAKRHARELFGPTVKITLSRDLRLEHDGTVRVVYTAIVSGDANYYGTGPTPREAVDHAARQLDEQLIVPAFGGFRVDGLASVLAGFHRSKNDARALARRMALDATYVDVAIGYGLPGVVDERPRKLAAVA